MGRKRVVNGIGQGRKISVPHRGRGNGRESGICLRLPQTLVSREEEQAVSHDRAAEISAKLIAMEKPFCRSEVPIRPGIRIQRGVTHVVVNLAVEHVGAALSD